MYKTKAAMKSAGVLGSLASIFIIVMNMMGVNISGEVSDLPARIATIIDLVMLLGTSLLSLYGRINAEAKISGVFKAKS